MFLSCYITPAEAPGVSVGYFRRRQPSHGRSSVRRLLFRRVSIERQFSQRRLLASRWCAWRVGKPSAQCVDAQPCATRMPTQGPAIGRVPRTATRHMDSAQHRERMPLDSGARRRRISGSALRPRSSSRIVPLCAHCQKTHEPSHALLHRCVRHPPKRHTACEG